MTSFWDPDTLNLSLRHENISSFYRKICLIYIKVNGIQKIWILTAIHAIKQALCVVISKSTCERQSFPALCRTDILTLSSTFMELEENQRIKFNEIKEHGFTSSFSEAENP